ncbi:MAG TPA: hypothetical protein VIM76_08185 [Candidatus Dormibacteraeota bacterium]|jgi:hypothetical protein
MIRFSRGFMTGAVLIAMVAGAGGCANQQGGTVGDLSRAASAASSAASTGRVAMELLIADKSTATVTDIALLNSLSESQDAETAAATAVVETAGEQRTRTKALKAIRSGTSAIVAARAVVSVGNLESSRTAAAGAVKQLAASADALSTLADRLEVAK